MQFTNSLRKEVLSLLEEKIFDIVIGIPSFNCETSIGKCLKTVNLSIKKHFSDIKVLVLVADGGSLDDTRENALDPNRAC